jgi:triosephosphate isomerase
MLCMGEPLHVKQANAGDAYVEQQLRLALASHPPPQWGGARGGGSLLTILYEPLWSVGAGGTAAEPADVARAFANIRRVLVSLFGAAGEAVPILYGGSVDATNCANYARLPDCAGMGVGRAGLRVEEFIAVLTRALAAR